MRFDILTITENGKRYYEVKVYSLSSIPASYLGEHIFKSEKALRAGLSSLMKGE